MAEEFVRTKALLGEGNMDILQKANVLVVGVGGVGGYVCEMLARSGVGNLTIVDHDKIVKSNLNRQIIALKSTIGMEKVEAMKQRIYDINPKCKTTAIFDRFDEKSADKILQGKYDFVIDAIDSLTDKTLLVKESQNRALSIVSALGTGNRIGIPNFKIADVYDTYNDGLARKFRKLLRDAGIEKLPVAFSDEKPLTVEKTEGCNKSIVGSVVYSPAMCGCVISAYVINVLLKNPT